MAVFPIDLDYELRGPSKGWPLILLHGWPLARFMWSEQVGPLEREGVSLVLPDLRGHGKSPIPDEPSTMERCAADVFRLADRLHLDRFALGGFSMGGYVALAMMREHPERVSALLLADTRAEADDEEARIKRKAMIEKIQARGPDALVEAMVPKFFTEETRRTRRELVDRVRRALLATPPAGAINGVLGMRDRINQRPTLSKIKVQTLILVGEHDELTPPSASQAMAASIPNAALHVIEGAAHLSPLESPDAFNAPLVEWVRSAMVPSGRAR